MAATSLHFAHCNFCRVHQTLRVTPAMEARLTEHVWSIENPIEPWTAVARWLRGACGLLNLQQMNTQADDIPAS
jgi:hypothetical protein